MFAPFSASAPLVGTIMDYCYKVGYGHAQTMLENYKQKNTATKKPTVLVVGYGWGSSAFTDRLDRSKYDLQIVSKTLYRFNQPRMIEALSPGFDYHNYATEFFDFPFQLANPLYKEPTSTIPLVQDTCISVNTNNKTVQGEKNNYPYDYLVISTGSEPNDFGIPGVQENCLMFKTEADLYKLRETLDNQSSVIVLGAGPTGLELACKLRALNKSVTVMEASNTILPGFSKDFQDLTLQHLQSKNIDLKLNSPVTSIQKTEIETKTWSIPSNQPVIWTCGIKPVPFVRTLAFPKQHLSVSTQLLFSPSVYAIGDSITGRGPPTAQNAKQQGHYLATLFNNDFQHTDYKYDEQGRVLDIATGYIVETQGHVFHVPSWLSFFVNAVRE